ERWERASPVESPVRVWTEETGAITTIGAGGGSTWLPGGQLVARQPEAVSGQGGQTLRVFGAEGGTLGEFHFSSSIGTPVWVSGRLVWLSGVPWLVEAINGSPPPLNPAGPHVGESAAATR